MRFFICDLELRTENLYFHLNYNKLTINNNNEKHNKELIGNINECAIKNFVQLKNSKKVVA